MAQDYMFNMVMDTVTTLTAARTFIQMVENNYPLKIHEIGIGYQLTSPVSKLFEVNLSKMTSAGTGTSFTPRKNNEAIAASDLTGSTTTNMVNGTVGTVNEIKRGWMWNVINGQFTWTPTPATQPTIAAGETWALILATAPVTGESWNAYITFEEMR